MFFLLTQPEFTNSKSTSKVTIKASFEKISHVSGVSIVNFEQVNTGWVVLLKINRYRPQATNI